MYNISSKMTLNHYFSI